MGENGRRLRRSIILSASGWDAGTGHTDLKKLNLLVFAQNKLRGFAPVGGVFPSVFDEARGVAIYLRGEGIRSKQAKAGNSLTFEQLSQR